MELRDLLDRDKFTKIQAQLKRKGYVGGLTKIAKLEDQRLNIIPKLDDLRAEANKLAKAKDIEGGKKISGEIKELEKAHKIIIEELNILMAEIPNLPFDDIPDGGEDDGQVVATIGTVPEISNPKDHTELGADLDILDLERAAKVSGSRFYYLKNQAVDLEFALIRWVGAHLARKGFTFLMGPQLLGERAMRAGGYLGKATDEVYKTQDDLYLNGTSEQIMLAYHMDEVIELPKRYASFSTCFRREAGSYGKDVKGIIRTHQFDKVEMFSFVKPEDSVEEHEFLISVEEEILNALELPYRKVILAAGDLGVASAKTIDMECWLPSQNRYRETHSCSNCTDWQAKLANIRHKTDSGNAYVHTLNGTAIAIGRLLVAILENYQQPDGSVKIPKVLQSHTGFKEIRK
ncbi:serine--tRNA ligase [Patescibacteria group bacterium]|nr:serine--tRNA ligase [Patescibacteria group bacterium]